MGSEQDATMTESAVELVDVTTDSTVEDAGQSKSITLGIEPMLTEDGECLPREPGFLVSQINDWVYFDSPPEATADEVAAMYMEQNPMPGGDGIRTQVTPDMVVYETANRTISIGRIDGVWGVGTVSIECRS